MVKLFRRCDGDSDDLFLEAMRYQCFWTHATIASDVDDVRCCGFSRVFIGFMIFQRISNVFLWVLWLLVGFHGFSVSKIYHRQPCVFFA